MAEQIKDGQAQENALLGYTLRAADAIGQRITLGFLPTRWPPDWQTTTPEVFQQQLKAAALTQTEWIPVLTVGGQQLAEASALDTGALNPNPDLNAPSGALGVPAAGGVGRVIDLFGEDGGTDGGAAPGRADGEFSALWIDYEIRVPGRPARTVRRERFDLLGPAKHVAGAEPSLTPTDTDRERRSVAMLGETQILIQASEFAPEFMMQLSANAAPANRPFLEEMARDPFAGPKADLHSPEASHKQCANGGPARRVFTLAAHLRHHLSETPDFTGAEAPLQLLGSDHPHAIGGAMLNQPESACVTLHPVSAPSGRPTNPARCLDPERQAAAPAGCRPDGGRGHVGVPKRPAVGRDHSQGRCRS